MLDMLASLERFLDLTELHRLEVLKPHHRPGLSHSGHVPRLLLQREQVCLGA